MQKIRRTLRHQHATPVIPKRKNAKFSRFNRGLYREQFRRVATHTRKTSRKLPSNADDCSDYHLIAIAHYARSRRCRYALDCSTYLTLVKDSTLSVQLT